MKKLHDIYILGISQSHNATAALLKNGKIIGCISEERFNRTKNFQGYPTLAIEFLLEQEGIKSSEIDMVALNFKSAIHFAIEHNASRIDRIYHLINIITYTIPVLNTIYIYLYEFYKQTINAYWYNNQIDSIYQKINISKDKIISFDHHLTHAASVVYGLGKNKEKVLVLTNDGAGDKYCTSVSIYKNNTFMEIAKTGNESSLAGMYGAVTSYLGMKINEHEYKVMGLAPYTNPDQEGVRQTIQILSRIFHVDDMKIVSSVDTRHYPLYLEKYLKAKRFDWIAYAIQKSTENILSQWVHNCIKKTGIHTICCAGGIFMNVKANKAISELESVTDMTVMPSSSDESTAIGAAYLGYVEFCTKYSIPIQTKKLENLYLGNSFSNDEVQTFIRQNNLHTEFHIRKLFEPEKEIARMLTQGKIVARFFGKMEFGARALGNRSILANPSQQNVIREINDRIKSRDFWMPFAASILAESEKEYIINPKKLDASYMILSFESTVKAKKTIFASLHPYDHTIRPQIVKKIDNIAYYNLIKEFKKLTGIGAILNTSLNLHGEPIVCSMEDAIHTLRDSNLQYLLMESYLFKKK